MVKRTIIAAVLTIAAGAALAQEMPRRGGIFIAALSTGEPDHYDCHASLSTAVLHRAGPSYSLLVKIDTANYPNVVSDAARDWTISPDGLTYEFHLNPGIKFHDGSVLTSADVKATYDRIRNPQPGTISMRQSLYRDIAAIETPSDNTVIFKLSQPNAAMLLAFASPWNCLYSARLLASDPDYPRRKVMGTGPFKFLRHVAGSEWYGERFDNYFRSGLPYLDGFKIVTMNGSAAINAISAGQIQFYANGVTVPERERITAARGDKIRFVESSSTAVHTITFNTERPPFNDERVRRALSMAIDRRGGTEPMSKITPFSVFGGFQRIGTPYGFSDDEIAKLPGFGKDIEQSRAEARRLLAEAGQSNLRATFLNRQLFLSEGVYAIDQWRRIGVTVEQEQLENEAFFLAQKNKNFQMTINSNTEFVDEPTMQLRALLSYDNNPQNISFAIDKKVDEMFNKQSRMIDVAARKEAVHELEAYLLTKAYAVPLFWSNRVIPVAAEVRGLNVTPSIFVHDITDVWIAN